MLETPAYFLDRHHAGEMLVEALADLKGQRDLLVVGIPRGGVVVASVVAKGLDAPLDVIVTRKLGAPGNPELAIGALASGGMTVLDEELIGTIGVNPRYLAETVEREREEIARREQLYRQGRPPLAVADRTTVVVDDGIATGSTMSAALRALRDMGSKALVLAVPVASHQAQERLQREADRVVCLTTPDPFWAVGLSYMYFGQTTDDEVVELLGRQGARHQGSDDEERPGGDEDE